jgi:hypothetical protein
MYLFDYVQDAGDTVTELDGIARDNNVTIGERSQGDDLTNGVTLYIRGGGCLYLSEFPGNCCALILHSIQQQTNIRGELSIGGRDALLAAIDMCKRMEYSLLFITGTKEAMKDMLITRYSFEPVLEGIYNPHSDCHNFFLVRKFDYSSSDDEESENDN